MEPVRGAAVFVVICILAAALMMSAGAGSPASSAGRISTPAPHPATPRRTPRPTRAPRPAPTIAPTLVPTAALAPQVTPVPTPPPTPRPATPAPTPPPPPPPPPPPQPPAVAASALAAGIIDLVNQQRAARGLGYLVPHGALIAASNNYAAVQWAHGPYALDHNLDGNSLDRALRQGYNGWIGEVLATGNPSAQELVNLWMASPAHSSILLGSFVHIGVGCQEGPYTTNGATYQIAVCVGMTGTPLD